MLFLSSHAHGAGGVFDPFGFSKGDEAMLRKYKENEIKNGRLAMVRAVGHMVHFVTSGSRSSAAAVPLSASVAICTSLDVHDRMQK